MIVTFIPVEAFALNGNSSSGRIVISDKTYEIAPGIIEREYITNNSALSAQQRGHVMEVDLNNSNAQIIAGYKDYDIKTISSGNNWGMTKTTEQARAFETQTGKNVVGAVNGDFFDMSNGRPSGVLVMQGTVVQQGSRACFYIGKDGKAGIVRNASQLPTDVQEAVGGGLVLVENGEITQEAQGDTTTNPRTMIGIKKTGEVIIFMVDGRQAPLSVGMTGLEMAQTMKDLGCEIALNLDGGGSSTFATQRAGDTGNNPAGLTMRCSPSDGYERTVSSSILVVSNAQSDGKFDHAVITPSQEIYTPGSIVNFKATGADKSGAPAELPNDIEWTVTSGEGTITDGGVFKAAEDFEGEATITISHEGKAVGSSTVELRWPDKLGFNNTSVSLDFGETSDMTFAPTYKGREIHYKDGDFSWTMEPEYYKHSVDVEKYYHPAWAAGTVNRWLQLKYVVTGNTGEVKEIKVSGTDFDYYVTKYKELKNEISYSSNGEIVVIGKIEHQGSVVKRHTTGEIIYENLTADIDDGYVKVKGLEKDKTYKFSLGTFTDNKFKADIDNSVRGKVRVQLKNDNSVSGTIDVVVGMEPHMIMDFEDRVDKDGVKITAEEYWKIKVGASSTGSFGELTSEEVKQNLLWVRMAGNHSENGVTWPQNGNRIVSSEDVIEGSNVRFGQHACKLAWDFSKVNVADVAASEFGFSGDLWVDNIKPTKIGMWINVPKSCECKDAFLNAVIKGNAKETSLSTSYFKMDENGDYVIAADGKQLNGTTSYTKYYSYDEKGNITGETLGDWAGKGWTWVEADISAYQMPIDLCRGYTVRVVSAQNKVKNTGYMYIDNLQFIYGTNTNDTKPPVLQSITENMSSVDLKTALERPTFTNKVVKFEVPITDNTQTDKYATGIDSSSIKVYVDGYDYTSEEGLFQISETEFGNTVTFQTPELTNGQHSIRVVVKDFYGNATDETYSYVINDETGKAAAVTVNKQFQALSPGGKALFNIVNVEGATSSAEVTFELPIAYIESLKKSESKITYGECYREHKAPQITENRVTIYAAKNDNQGNQGIIASIELIVPGNVKKGEAFNYAVPEANYKSGQKTETFSLAEERIPYTADYDIKAGAAVVEMLVDFIVTDEQGKEVKDYKLYGADGKEITKPLYETAGKQSVYAKTDDGKRSWQIDFTVCAKGTEGNGKPFGIQNNASSNGSNIKEISWLSAIGHSAQKATIKYSLNENLSDAVFLEGESDYITFDAGTGEAYRINSVTVNTLAPNTTYYYQVGDDDNWSKILTFKTSGNVKDGNTNFFILGDIQTERTDKLSSAVNKIKESGKDYSFGIQVGDAVDDVKTFPNWRSYFNVLNSDTLSGTDVFHVLGNHEYYGDADGETAGKIFSLPDTRNGSFYSSEYGSVYVAVVNFQGDLIKALEQVKVDADKSDCAWKVLTLHEPIYGTQEEMNLEARKQAVKLIEEAGIDFVFTGHHHSYARTYPMIKDEAQTEDSRAGVVYYVCGDLSGKGYAHTTQPYFAKDLPREQYNEGMYMTAEATAEKMTIKAFDYMGNLLDTYEETKTSCETGKHTFSEASRYDLNSKTITCASCGNAVDAAANKVTGKYAVTETEEYVVLVEGIAQTGWFTFGDEMHAGEDGILHNITVSDSATCLEDGNYIYTCDCGEIKKGAKTSRKGHSWDENHVCSVCNAKGISMDDVTLKLNGDYWIYTGKPIMASSRGYYNGYELVASGSAYGTDAFKSFSNNINVGMGTITYEGRGNFYGSKSIDFKIIPQDVTQITATQVMSNAAFIKWDAAGGAQTYEVYMRENGGSWKLADKTSDTALLVDELNPNSTYTFRIKTSALSNGKRFEGAGWSAELEIKTDEASGGRTEDYIQTLNTSVMLSGTVQSATVHMTEVGHEKYLFLPSAADITKLQLNAALTGVEGEFTIMGSKGSTVIANYTNFDVTQIADKNKDDKYEILVSLPNCQPMKLIVMKSENIPSMFIVSSDPASKGRDYVDAVKGNKGSGNMVLLGSNGVELYNGVLKEIKARGNSTFGYYPKKAYQIKIDAADLVGGSEDVKTWVLLANYGDATMMHDKLMKDLARANGMPYVANCNWTDLFYDGEYRGTYLITEKNGIGSTSVNITDLEEKYEAVNPDYGENAQIAEGTNKYGQKYQYVTGLVDPDDITGGYLIERNLEKFDEISGFYTKKGAGFNVKNPEYASEKAVAYISEYYQEFEDAVFAVDENGNHTGINSETGKHYYEYCDKDSLVKVFLMQEFALNTDGFLSSLYFYKDVNGIMCAGPIWDQDMTMGTGWDMYVNPNMNFYRYLAEALIKIPDFKEAVKEYYQSTFRNQINQLAADNGTIMQHVEKLSASAAMNYVIWPYVRIGSPEISGHLWASGTTYNTVTADLLAWVRERIANIDALYGDNFHEKHTYTSEVTKEPTYSEEGLKTYTCTICGHTYTETIPKLSTPGGIVGGGGGVFPPAEQTEQPVYNENGEGKNTIVNAKQETEIKKSEDNKIYSSTHIGDKLAEQMLAEAEKNKSDNIIINAIPDEDNLNVDEAKVNLGTEMLEGIIDRTDANLSVKTTHVQLTFTEKTLKNLANIAKEKDVVITTSSVNNVKNGMGFEISIVAGDKKITRFTSDKITVKAMITPELKNEKLVSLYIDKDGFAVKLDGKKSGSIYEFKTASDGIYKIVTVEEADRIFASQKNRVNKITSGVMETKLNLVVVEKKKGSKLAWRKSWGYKVDGFQIFRSVKKTEGYSRKPVYVVSSNKTAYYVETKNLKKGKRYYYKVRGVRKVAGKTIYTKWSNVVSDKA
ncbi:MAG: phosphodiester glycosidase family protein [Firmicutes bacterium]|nr:phosphodiester glycosidase family protein [Bacillota bacterium]